MRASENKSSILQRASIIDTEDVVIHSERSPFHQLTRRDRVCSRASHVDEVEKYPSWTAESRLACIIGVVERVCVCCVELRHEELSSRCLCGRETIVGRSTGEGNPLIVRRSGSSERDGQQLNGIQYQPDSRFRLQLVELSSWSRRRLNPRKKRPS